MQEGRQADWCSASCWPCQNAFQQRPLCTLKKYAALSSIYNSVSVVSLACFCSQLQNRCPPAWSPCRESRPFSVCGRWQSAQKVQQDSGLPAEATFTADIVQESDADLCTAMKGVDALIIATSAKPQIYYSSLPKVNMLLQILLSTPSQNEVITEAGGERMLRV